VRSTLHRPVYICTRSLQAQHDTPLKPAKERIRRRERRKGDTLCLSLSFPFHFCLPDQHKFSLIVLLATIIHSLISLTDIYTRQEPFFLSLLSFFFPFITVLFYDFFLVFSFLGFFFLSELVKVFATLQALFLVPFLVKPSLFLFVSREKNDFLFFFINFFRKERKEHKENYCW